MGNKKYSFDKKKVIDADVVEKSSSEIKKDGKKVFSFANKFKSGVSKIAGAAKDSYIEYNKPENVLARKKFQASKTKLDADIAKNKATIKKYSNNEKQDLTGLGLGTGKKKKKSGNDGLFDGGFF